MSGDPVKLLENGSIDPGMIMAMNIRPNSRIAVEVFASLGVAQDCAPAFDDYQRFVLWRAPFRHICEWMPDERFVRGHEIPAGPISHCRSDSKDDRATRDHRRWRDVAGICVQ